MLKFVVFWHNIAANNTQLANEYVPVPSSSVYFVDLEKVFPIKNKYHLKSLMPGSIRIYPLDTRRELKVHETFTLREKSFPHFLFPHSNWIWRYDQNNSECKHFTCQQHFHELVHDQPLWFCIYKRCQWDAKIFWLQNLWIKY